MILSYFTREWTLNEIKFCEDYNELLDKIKEFLVTNNLFTINMKPYLDIFEANIFGREHPTNPQMIMETPCPHKEGFDSKQKATSYYKNKNDCYKKNYSFEMAQYDTELIDYLQVCMMRRFFEVLYLNQYIRNPKIMEEETSKKFLSLIESGQDKITDIVICKLEMSDLLGVRIYLTEDNYNVGGFPTAIDIVRDILNKEDFIFRIYLNKNTEYSPETNDIIHFTLEHKGGSSAECQLIAHFPDESAALSGHTVSFTSYYEEGILFNPRKVFVSSTNENFVNMKIPSSSYIPYLIRITNYSFCKNAFANSVKMMNILLMNILPSIQDVEGAETIFDTQNFDEKFSLVPINSDLYKLNLKKISNNLRVEVYITRLSHVLMNIDSYLTGIEYNTHDNYIIIHFRFPESFVYKIFDWRFLTLKLNNVGEETSYSYQEGRDRIIYNQVGKPIKFGELPDMEESKNLFQVYHYMMSPSELDPESTDIKYYNYLDIVVSNREFNYTPTKLIIELGSRFFLLYDKEEPNTLVQYSQLISKTIYTPEDIGEKELENNESGEENQSSEETDNGNKEEEVNE